MIAKYVLIPALHVKHMYKPITALVEVLLYVINTVSVYGNRERKSLWKNAA